MTRRLLATTLVARLAGSAADAQTTTTPQPTVQDILGFLVTNQGVQTSDFDKDRAAAEATRATLTRALLSSIATLPVGTSSGGFTYRFNPALGTAERASETFGPFYVERALTAGAGQASVGFTLQYASFQSLDGNDLRNGGFVTVANQFTDEAQPFDVERLTLNISTKTATVFGTVGLSDRVDLGVAVPLIRLDVTGTRLNTYRGITALQATAAADAGGFGDIAVRSKVRLTGDGPGAISAGVEAKLPTGRAEDLLGTGEFAMKFLGLASYESGAASIYGNFGLGTGGIGREVTYSAAGAVAMTPRVTLVGELLGQRIAGMQRIVPVVAPHPRIRGVTTTRLMPSGEDQTDAYAVAGMKWNVGGTWLLHANVLFPLTDGGLTTTFTPTVSLDYSFAR
jgi:hypothetical protein